MGYGKHSQSLLSGQVGHVVREPFYRHPSHAEGDSDSFDERSSVGPSREVLDCATDGSEEDKAKPWTTIFVPIRRVLQFGHRHVEKANLNRHSVRSS